MIDRLTEYGKCELARTIKSQPRTWGECKAHIVAHIPQDQHDEFMEFINKHKLSKSQVLGFLIKNFLSSSELRGKYDGL